VTSIASVATLKAKISRCDAKIKTHFQEIVEKKFGATELGASTTKIGCEDATD
jgi:hypothetical protein